MTTLKDLLIAQIRASGPVTLAEYISLCLMHPRHGYYATRDPLGADGDFTTAPEISQMFGELMGLSLAQAWLNQGAPPVFALAELGPGRGTLMADVLRATLSVPGFHDAAQLHLVEASPKLREVQRETLGRDDVTWHDGPATLPQLPLFLLANEFFDALPCRQFRRDGVGWRERQVGIRDGSLTFGWSDPAPHPQLEHRLADTNDGDIVELGQAAAGCARTIGAHIDAHGGVALIADYGDWRSLGDTFQALEQHEAADPLANPGRADLTTHVDFEALTRATPSKFSRLTPQGVFLERLGITQRAQLLAGKLEGCALENHIAAHRRLTHPQEMGTLFKVIAFFPDGADPPPGLEP